MPNINIGVLGFSCDLYPNNAPRVAWGHWVGAIFGIVIQAGNFGWIRILIHFVWVSEIGKFKIIGHYLKDVLRCSMNKGKPCVMRCYPDYRTWLLN